MSDFVRRAGRFVDEAGATVTWSAAEGRRGRRWRWTIGDRRGAGIVAHTLETDPGGAFARLESASGTGLLTLHREADGSVHGNRVTARGVDHLLIPAPAPERAIVGSTAIGVAALVAGLGPAEEPGPVDVVEVLDDLGVRVVEISMSRGRDGAWEVHAGRNVRRVRLDADDLPGDGERSWPLEAAR